MVNNRMSDPSMSIDEINIPEIDELSAEFVYNYYVADERVNPATLSSLPLEKIPRYVFLRWSPPSLSDFERIDQNLIESQPGNRDLFSIEKNSQKLVSEDTSLNPQYYSHVFSNVDAIQQATSDIEIYGRMSGVSSESMPKMAEQQLKNLSISSADDSDKANKLVSLFNSYSQLSNFPQSSLGLKVSKNDKEIKDEQYFLETAAKLFTTKIKLHGAIIPDVFENSNEKLDKLSVSGFNALYASVRNSPVGDSEAVTLDPIKIDKDDRMFKYLKQPVRITGYVIERFRLNPEGFQKDSTIYIEDPTISSYVDRTVLYGESYVYTVKVVANVQMLMYSNPDERSESSKLSTLYVTSKNITTSVECFEYVAPPPPQNLRFSFDYVNFKLMIEWDDPTNPQKDIRQYQVLRRKSIKEPFELIAQYGFDTSIPGSDGKKYLTGEVVDANNFQNMSEEAKTFVKNLQYAVYSHVDLDFKVDTEFFISSDYIYAVCSVDAHGLISNYSKQYQVVFDSIKNRLVTKLICDAGSPRQYPNMNLSIDTFKDVIHVEGKDLKKLQVFFTPEYLRVKDAIRPSQQYKIIEAQTPVPSSKNSYYLLQLINLDNQKLQTVKINVTDKKGLTI